MKKQGYSLKDDISDALFRKMIRQNIPLLLLMTAIIIAVSVFLYSRVAHSHFLVKKEIVLVKNGKRLSGVSLENQKYIRLLKQRSVREKLVETHDLALRYSIDLENENALFRLDKALIDRLKVEEQKYGEVQLEILLRFPVICIMMI